MKQPLKTKMYATFRNGNKQLSKRIKSVYI